MGDEADDILASFGLNEADSKKYDVVKGKFENYFIKKRNVIFECAKFNQRIQEKGETVDQFITVPYQLAEHCNYGGLWDEMIRDRIVVGLHDAKLSLRLQMDEALTLEKAISTARQSESIKKQQAVVRGQDSATQSVEVIRFKKFARKDNRRVINRPKVTKYGDIPINKPGKTKSCTRCGRIPSHPKHQCPAREATCHKCTKKGHFQAFCRSKNTVGEVFSDSDSDIDKGFLGVIEDDSSHIDTVQEVHRNPWHVSLHINGATVEFKIDTGADVSVVPKSLLNKLKITSLKQSKKNLQGPGSNTLAVQGKFTAVVTYKRKKVTEDIYVIQNLRTPLLGRPAIEKLGLLSRVNNIEEKSSTVMSEFPKLFKGLGSLEGEYRIELKQNATPFALSTPRRVAIPLMWKVKKELEAMEKMGIITRVNQPTDWCSGMVVVPKSNGKVRICVDMTKLNENVRREQHVLPSVEHTLAQLGDARMFS